MTAQSARELQVAFTSLLATPALSRAASPEIFHLVRRHQHRLAEWFDTRLGYRLVLSATTARLVRLASPTGVVSPAPFEPVPRRALVLALLAAAVAEDADEITSTQELSDRVSVLSAREEVGVEAYDPDRFAERRTFVQGLGMLLRAGALVPLARRDEDAREGWAHQRDQVGGAYQVQREMLLRLVHPANLTTALGADPHGPRPDGPGGHGPTDAAEHPARFGVMRRIVELPVCLVADLAPREQEYLAGQRPRIAQWCEEMTGWTLEHRREGVALVPDHEGGTDLPFPRPRARDFAALMVLGELVRAVSPVGSAAPVVSREDLLGAADRVRTTYPRAMTKDLAGTAAVADRSVELLVALDLLRPGPVPGSWHLMPAAARFRDPAVSVGGEPHDDAQPRPENQSALFDTEVFS